MERGADIEIVRSQVENFDLCCLVTLGIIETTTIIGNYRRQSLDWFAPQSLPLSLGHSVAVDHFVLYILHIHH